MATTGFETFLARLEAKGDAFWQLVSLTVLGPILLAGVARLLLEAAIRVHPALGWIVAALAVLAVYLMARHLKRRRFNGMSGPEVFSLFVVTALLGVVAFAAASTLWAAVAPAEYSSTRPLSIGVFVDFYTWLLIDALPGIKMWTTFGVEPPVTYTHAFPGFLVLGFRLLITIYLLKSFLEWIKAPSRHVAPDAA